MCQMQNTKVDRTKKKDAISHAFPFPISEQKCDKKRRKKLRYKLPVTIYIDRAFVFFTHPA